MKNIIEDFENAKPKVIEDNKPLLESATFHFTQDANCVDGEREYEALDIICESSLGIDRDGGCFFVLKTDSWSVDNVGELEELFNRIRKVIHK